MEPATRPRPVRTAIAAAAVVAALAACDGGRDEGTSDTSAALADLDGAEAPAGLPDLPTTTTPTTATTATAPPPTGPPATAPTTSTPSAAPPSTGAPTTLPAPTTTAPIAAATTTPAMPASTDAPPPTRPVEAAGGSVVLRGDGLGVVSFGDTESVVLGALSPVLGEPVLGPVEVGVESAAGLCDHAEVRMATWPGLTLLFGDEAIAFEPATGQRSMVHWSATGGSVSTGSGASVGDPLAALGADLTVHDDELDDRDASARVPLDGGTVTAFSDAADGSGAITGLAAGTACEQ